MRFARAQAANGGTEPVEIGYAVLAAHDAFAIDRDGLNPQLAQGFRDPWHPIGPVVATAGEYAHLIAVASADEPKAVVLDFVCPLRPGRHGVRVGREARLDEAGWSPGRTVTLYTIERLETGSEISGAAMTKGLAAVKATLEAEGIEFINNASVLGVLFRPKKAKARR